MGMMKIGLDDNALSTTSKMESMVFFSQNHDHYELVTGNEITEHIHNVKPLTLELTPGGTGR
jgi:hypothetical protein